MKYGYLFQGQRYNWQKRRRGKPTWGMQPSQFVTYIQNHDQIANSGRGERLHRSPALAAICRSRFAAARARHPHAVSGAGVRRLQPVLFFCRS